jgi:hypothetical protein
MKAIAYKNILNADFQVLTQDELNEIRGGGTPKTRDKDIYEFEEE